MFLNPDGIAALYPDIGEKKAKLRAGPLLARAALAGAFIALAAVGYQAAASLLPDKGAASVLGALLFPAGLVMVLLAGGELFTGNHLMILGVWAKRVTPAAMLRNWGLVLAGNAAGAALVALLSVGARRSDPQFLAVATRVAEAKAALPFLEAFLRGVLCNILVCTAVWISYSAQSAEGKILACYFPVALFVLCGTEHCVANFYYQLAGILAAEAPALSQAGHLLANLVPVILGNVAGGALVLGPLLWAGFYKGKA